MKQLLALILMVFTINSVYSAEVCSEVKDLQGYRKRLPYKKWFYFSEKKADFVKVDQFLSSPDPSFYLRGKLILKGSKKLLNLYKKRVLDKRKISNNPKALLALKTKEEKLAACDLIRNNSELKKQVDELLVEFLLVELLIDAREKDPSFNIAAYNDSFRHINIFDEGLNQGYQITIKRTENILVE